MVGINSIQANQGLIVTLKELIQLRASAKAIDLNFHHKIRSHLLGGHLSNLKGRGIDFDEVRAYQAGDDIRYMDWKVTARRGIAHTKLFHEERERPVFLLIDLNESMFFATKVALKSVIAARASALLAWAAISNGDRVGALICTEANHIELRPKTRKQGVLPLLKNLVDVQKRLRSNHRDPAWFAQTLARLRHVAKSGSLIFILSDFLHFDAECARHINILSRYYQLITCLIRDPIEIIPPPPGRYAMTDGKHLLALDFSDQSLSQGYQQMFAKRYRQLLSMLSECAIPCIELRTDQAILDSFLSAFRNKRASIK